MEYRFPQKSQCKVKGIPFSFPFLFLCVWKVDVMAGLPAAILNHKVNVLTLGRWRGKLADPETLTILGVFTQTLDCLPPDFFYKEEK